MKMLEAILRLIRKTLEAAPVIVLSIVFVLGMFIVPPAASYTITRMQLYMVEDSASAHGYHTADGWKEDWDNQYGIFHKETRRERYNELKGKMSDLVATSQVAKMCNEYGETSGMQLKRNCILIAIGISWILSGIWLVGFAHSEICYLMRKSQKRKSKRTTKRRNMEVKRGRTGN